MDTSTNISKQKGIAMIVTLLLLIVLTIIALSSSRNTTLQLRMSSNMQSRIEAIQYAQAALDLVVEKVNIGKMLDVNDSMCASTADTPEYPVDMSCNTTFIDNNTNIIDLKTIEPFKSASGDTTLTIKYYGDVPLPETTIPLMRAHFFEAHSTYDDTAHGRGKVTLAIGTTINRFD